MEELKDLEVVCRDCGETFTLTVDDQKFYLEKGFDMPKRCLNCRRQRRQEQNRKEN